MDLDDMIALAATAASTAEVAGFANTAEAFLDLIELLMLEKRGLPSDKQSQIVIALSNNSKTEQKFVRA